LVLFYSTIFGIPSIVLGMGLLLSRRGRTKQNPVAVPATAHSKGASS
jgi:hypothetical protein